MGTAFGAGRTGVVVDARIDTLRVLTLLIRRTIAVAATSNDVAALVRVAPVSAAASALGLVASHIALAILATWVLDQARIDANAVDAGLACVTFSVRPASDCATGCLRVTLIARLTAAHGPVIVNVALSVESAVARVSTLAVDARLRCWALGIALAAWFTLQHHLGALAIDVGHPQFGAFADHGANRYTVQDRTLGRGVTWLQFNARIFAASVDASQSIRTVWVGNTFGLVGNHWATFTVRERVAQRCLLGTDAVSHMIAGVALGVLGAR